ncbi:MAG: SMI1/KNR4 family protein [Pseudomonadota bacterium]
MYKILVRSILLPDVPQIYSEYIKENGPFEGFTVDNSYPGYVALWRLEELAKNNADIDIEMCAPGYVAFGGDAGGEVLAFDKTGSVFMLPLIGMEAQYARHIANDFQELAARFKT